MVNSGESESSKFIFSAHYVSFHISLEFSGEFIIYKGNTALDKYFKEVIMVVNFMQEDSLDYFIVSTL